ncbi:MAG: AAA family ATPase [bacterium]
MSSNSIADKLLQEGVSSFQRGNYQETRKKCALALQHQPENAQILFWMAASHYHLGDIHDAKKQLEKLLSEEKPPLPERPAAVYEYLCRCYISADAQKAIDFGKEGINKDPHDPRIHLVVGNAYFRLENIKKALRHYDKAWEYEGGREGKPVFLPCPGIIPFSRSAALIQLKEWESALEAIEDALFRDPENATYHNRKSVILFDGLNRFHEAVQSVERAIELDPGTVGTGNDGVYYYNLAHYLRKINKNEKALSAIDNAISIAPRPHYKKLRKTLTASANQEAMAEPSAAATSNFAMVGGMNALKEQVRRIIAIIYSNHEEAKRYGIVRNGILLYGPPGCGKSFFAEAIAGEFSLRFIPVNLGIALNGYGGSDCETIEKLFEQARSNVPCVLFLDEFDALAKRRSYASSQHEQQMLNALLYHIDEHREMPGFVLVAATNHLEDIDPAAIREGRFDYKVKIYKPDFNARQEILHVLLKKRPHDGLIDITRFASDMEGFTAAQIRHVVDEAALKAMEANATISNGHMREAYTQHITAKRYHGKRLRWDDLILSEAKKRQLQFIEKFIENADIARGLGIEAPRGVLLFGPPGTGKTTIARVLASETDASFFAINAADLFSKWLGESEQRVKELFEKARDSVPAVIFIDEIDSVLGRRSDGSSGGDRTRNAVINIFLSEMDGIESSDRIFVIGATNRPELLDEAALRPGRLSESIEIGLPDETGRIAMLKLFSRKMRLDDSVNFSELARETENASGADLKGLCTAAGRNAFLRALEDTDGTPTLIQEDFKCAIKELFPQKGWGEQERPIGFSQKSYA